VLAPRDIDEYILPTERRAIRVRLHWVVMLSDILQTGLALAVLIAVSSYLPHGVVIDTLTWYAGLVVVLRLGVLIALWWVERIVITDKRVMLSRGILTHRIAMMPLKKVTDLTFRQSILGRILDYGTMVFESAGQIQGLDRVEFMPHPEETYDAITQLIFGDVNQTRSYRLGRPTRRG
jgi:uncharacterized membrane protein YdbT with pleckstrin-like domain